MEYQASFERRELKYLITRRQKEFIFCEMAPHMAPDPYGRTIIRNLYYDTDTFLLIRRSLEHPVYKEKLRLRSYQKAAAGDPVFVELKKKYLSVVYKRRIAVEQGTAMRCLRDGSPFPTLSQATAGELACFCARYGALRPAVGLSYEREAFFSRNGSDLRITFDENILYRREDLDAWSEAYGTPLLEPEMTLMELKSCVGLPLWIVRALSLQKIYKTSFSKYGAAYQRICRLKCAGGLAHA